MYQQWVAYSRPESGAEPFIPHKFETKQTIINQEDVPKVLVTPEAYANQLAIAQLSGDDEIGWLGSVKPLGDNKFLIEQIFLIEQVVHGSTTKMTEEGLADLFTDLANDDPELCASILFWGHVHPANSTDPSSQDEDQMKLFNHNDWFIRGIFGRSGRAEFSFFDYKKGVIWKDIPWQIYTPLTEDVQAGWKAQIAAKVSKIVYTAPAHVYNPGVYHGGVYDHGCFVHGNSVPGSTSGNKSTHYRDRMARGLRGKKRGDQPANVIILPDDDWDDWGAQGRENIVKGIAKSVLPMADEVKTFLSARESGYLGED